MLVSSQKESTDLTDVKAFGSLWTWATDHAVFDDIMKRCQEGNISTFDQVEEELSKIVCATSTASPVWRQSVDEDLKGFVLKALQPCETSFQHNERAAALYQLKRTNRWQEVLGYFREILEKSPGFDFDQIHVMSEYLMTLTSTEAKCRSFLEELQNLAKGTQKIDKSWREDIASRLPFDVILSYSAHFLFCRWLSDIIPSQAVRKTFENLTWWYNARETLTELYLSMEENSSPELLYNLYSIEWRQRLISRIFAKMFRDTCSTMKVDPQTILPLLRDKLKIDIVDTRTFPYQAMGSANFLGYIHSEFDPLGVPLVFDDETKNIFLRGLKEEKHHPVVLWCLCTSLGNLRFLRPDQEGEIVNALIALITRYKKTVVATAALAAVLKLVWKSNSLPVSLITGELLEKAILTEELLRPAIAEYKLIRYGADRNALLPTVNFLLYSAVLDELLQTGLNLLGVHWKL